MTTSDNASGQNPPTNCRWCGSIHGPLCPSVKAIEYDETGLIVRRVEFHSPQPFNPPFGWPWSSWGDPRFTAAAPQPAGWNVDKDGFTIDWSHA